MSDNNLGSQVTGPTLELAAKVKAALEAGAGTDVTTEYGTFFVRTVELGYAYGGDCEIVGYLVPDEAEGKTFDFYTPRQFDPKKV